MKYIVLIVFLVVFGCSKTAVERNPFLLEKSFNLTINLALPSFNNLSYPGGSLYWPNDGIRGLLLYNLNGNTIMAWEASCPNHELKSCSTLQTDGLVSATASCSCEDYQYSLATGQPLTEGATYSLLFYKVQQSGTVVRIYN